MIEQIRTESPLNEDNDMSSKREMMFKTHYPPMFKLEEKERGQKKKDNKIHNIDTINKFKNNNINYLGNSIYHNSKKEKKKKELTKSTSNAFEPIKLSSVKNDDYFLDKKKELDNHQRKERSSKSIKKRKNKSINYYQEKEESKSDDSKNNKEIPKNINNNININNNKHKEYIGEKILINIENITINKYNKSNNISDFKKKELSNDNIYEKRYRLSCIINNSPFVNSNLLLKNKKSVASLDSLLDKELSRFFEKNKNDYKGKTIKELLERIPDDIFQEIDSDLNDKLYELDPSKINIGQIHKEDKMYIRNITNLDGNAFLRAFLFNYLEQIISRKDIIKLTELLGRIKTCLKSVKIEKEEINKVLSVFKIIVKFIEQNNMVSAYIILIKSFSENYDFDKNLMIYMRQCLSESIKRHQSYFIIDYLKEIVSNKYIKFDNKNNKEYFDYELYLKEVINSESNNNELQYELLVYYFLASIFDIDLIIYTDNDSKTNKIIFRYSTIPNEDESIISIDLFIKFGNISIIYSDNYYKKYENIIPLKSKEKYPIDKIQIIKNEEKKNCYMCHCIPFEFIQIDYKFELICRKCLSDKIIKKIIDKRYFLFSDTDNSYFNEEYYCNKINYVINPDQNDSYELDISINDIRNILNTNLDIASTIHQKIVKISKCCICEKNFNKKLYCYCMNKCGDLICSDCLKDYIIKATEGKVVFNIYESKLKKIKYFCPKCNEEIYLSKNLINNLFEDDTYIDKAEERLIEAAETICCFCGFSDEYKLRNKFIIKNEFVSSNYSEEYFLLMHSLCKNCYNKIKKKDLNDSKKTFFCNFCNEKHQYNKIVFCNQKRKGCCLII